LLSGGKYCQPTSCGKFASAKDEPLSTYSFKLDMEMKLLGITNISVWVCVLTCQENTAHQSQTASRTDEHPNSVQI